MPKTCYAQSPPDPTQRVKHCYYRLGHPGPHSFGNVARDPTPRDEKPFGVDEELTRREMSQGHSMTIPGEMKKTEGQAMRRCPILRGTKVDALQCTLERGHDGHHSFGKPPEYITPEELSTTMRPQCPEIQHTSWGGPRRCTKLEGHEGGHECIAYLRPLTEKTPDPTVESPELRTIRAIIQEVQQAIGAQPELTRVQVIQLRADAYLRILGAVQVDMTREEES